jgi:AcrR family transcriptional regulator
LDDVARRAGVSKGTLYLYFDSKEDLFKAVIREGYVTRITEFSERMKDFQGSSADLIRELVDSWWTQIGATKLAGITKLMMSEAGNFPELANFYHDEVVVRGTGLFAAAIQRGIAAGEFRDVALDYAPIVACAPVIMLMLWRNSFDLCGTHQMNPRAFLDTHTDMLLHALAAEKPQVRQNAANVGPVLLR